MSLNNKTILYPIFALILMVLLSAFVRFGIPKFISISPRVPPRTYKTNFAANENPISENGNWINGKTNGLNWSDISTSNGMATGHQKGNVHYKDATALLTGAWGADQMAKATVFCDKTYITDYPEVELRLRSSLTAHKCSGYEIAFSAAGKTSKAYVMLVRWNGPVGDFTVLKQPFGPQYTVVNGDVVKATMIGNTLTAYINGIKVAHAEDTTCKSGSPGMGFNFDWADSSAPKGKNSSYGFTDFTATDDLKNPDF
jgi:hypothetical protein